MYFHVERLLWIGAKIGIFSIRFLTVCVCVMWKWENRPETGRNLTVVLVFLIVRLRETAVMHWIGCGWTPKQARHILVGSAPIYGNLWSFSFFTRYMFQVCKNNVCKMFFMPSHIWRGTGIQFPFFYMIRFMFPNAKVTSSKKGPQLLTFHKVWSILLGVLALIPI